MYGVACVLLFMEVPCLSLSVKASPLLIFCFPCGVFILFYFLVFSSLFTFVM
jgi:hypothetical protein